MTYEELGRLAKRGLHPMGHCRSLGENGIWYLWDKNMKCTGNGRYYCDFHKMLVDNKNPDDVRINQNAISISFAC